MASFFTGFVPSFFAGVYGNVGKGSYWVFTELLFDLERVFLIGCTGFHRVLLGFVELFSLWKGFYWVLLGFTESLQEVCLIWNSEGLSERLY